MPLVTVNAPKEVYVSNILKTLTFSISLCILITTGFIGAESERINSSEQSNYTEEIDSSYSLPICGANKIPNLNEVPIPQETVTVQTTVAPQPIISSSDLDLLSLIMVAESEGECEDGQRLVIDTVLNRVDSPKFPNTIHDVIYQKNQFSSVWNGRVNRCSVTDKDRQLVLEEVQSRRNYEVLYFTAGKYGAYGTPMFKVGNHYFSSK